MRVHAFPKSICPKVNVIARLEFELAFYESAVHRFNHYTTRTPPHWCCGERAVWHYVGDPPSRRFLCLFWRETRQRVWTQDLDATGSRKRTRVGSWTKELREGSWQQATESGRWSRHRTAELTSRHEIESSISEGRPVKMSQYSSWFVEFSLEIHASVSLQGIQSVTT